MIARGDLGVEMPVQQLPVLQKKLLGLCRDAGKPVAVATQMLESMVVNPVPTRAEVNDVATAIYDGADAIMLSAETAAGANPLAADGIMVDVALEVENDSQYLADLMMSKDRKRGQTGSPLAGAVRELAVGGEVSAICCFTRSGLTAIGQARERAPVPIFALTPDKQTARFLELVWGVHSVVVNSVYNFNLAVENAITTVKSYASHEKFSHIAVTAGVPVHRSGTTNMLRIVALN